MENRKRVGIARRIAAGNLWYHVTPTKYLKSILKNGLKKGASNYGEWKTGEGVYLSENLMGAEWYVENFRNTGQNDVVILEISGLDESGLLMDEDQVGNVFDEEFNEAFAGYSEDGKGAKYPEAAAQIRGLVENEGVPFNDAVIKVIDELRLKPDRELIDDSQGGIGALTARYVGTIRPDQIRVVKLPEDDGTEG